MYRRPCSPPPSSQLAQLFACHRGMRSVHGAVTCHPCLCLRPASSYRRHAGYSYEQIMLRPLAEAIAPLLAPKGPVRNIYFALQGEMGATVSVGDVTHSYAPTHTTHTRARTHAGAQRHGGAQ